MLEFVIVVINPKEIRMVTVFFVDAVIKYKVGIVQGMIRAGVNVNEKLNNTTPLHYAVRGRHAAIVRLLLEHGAIASITDGSSSTPLHTACLFDDEYSYNIVELLLEKGADCNSKQDKHERTPFHLALKSQTLKVVKLMLDHRADITAVSKNRETALHFAAENRCHADVCQLVLNKGLFSIDSRNHWDMTALCIAVHCQNLEGCKLLLRHGADINSRGGKHDRYLRPLDIATHRSFITMLQMLLDYGADLANTTENLSVIEWGGLGQFKAEVNTVLMRHIARMEYTNRSITEEDRRTIQGNDFYKKYYQASLEEFEKMKEKKFYNHVSVFSVLMDSDKIVAGYARNEELVRALEESDCEQQFPICLAGWEILRPSEETKGANCRGEDSQQNLWV